jgi:hypothetical protein
VNKYNPDYWTPRLALGIQKTPFFEIGISRLRVTSRDLEFGSGCFYSSLEINRRLNTKSDTKYFYGIKFGLETSFAILMWGIETKYITDFNSDRILITPKIGLSYLGIFNLLYGYNYPKKLGDFDGIGHYQFTLIVNLNKRVYNSEIKRIN